MNEPGDFGVNENVGSGLACRHSEFGAEAFGIFDLAVGEQRGSAETIGGHPLETVFHFDLAEHAVRFDALIEREHVIGDHAEANHPGWASVARVERHDQAHWLDQVRGYAKEQFALAEGFAHERNVAVLEITQTTVNQSTRPGRDSVAEVFLLNQSHLEAALGCVAHDAETVDSRTDYDEVITRIL